MLRVDVVSKNKRETILKVDGRIEGKAVAILEQEVVRWTKQTQQLILDLGGLQFIDSNGLALLKGYVGKQVFLRHETAFIRELLEANDFRLIPIPRGTKK